ncbi:MAG TPA: PEGA domain-containing protein [Polyangiaceae bacterium]
MRARSLVAALAIAFGRAALPAPALAAPPAAPAASPADLAAAKKLFATGLKLYNEGSFREALSAFAKANAIAPRVSLQRNIAQCHRDLKDFAAAYDAYGVLLAKYGATMSAPDRRSVQHAIDELATLTGTIHLAVTEPGATVSLDDHDAGTTPLAAALRANLGTHLVTVAKPGFETIRKEVRLSGGDEVTVAGPLEPEATTGHLVVGAPPDAKVEVFVDGADVGPAPWEGDVKPGVHVVEARGQDRFAGPKQVDVARRQRVEMALELATATGRVQIDTHTADAAIAIDGAPVGKGVWEGTLPAGEHEVTIEAPGFRPYKRPFFVHAGETFAEDARLESLTPGNAAPTYEGLYSGLEFFGFATPTGPSNQFAKNCPSAPCASSSPLGAGLGVRFGYAFGWVAVEAMALGSYDYSTASVTYASGGPTDVGRSESYAFHRFGGGGAIGARFATKHPHLRLTGAVLGGFETMGNIYKQDASATVGGASSEETSSTTTYTAPLLLADAGVLVGWTNGAKLHVSLVTMLQFVGGAVMAPGLSPTSLGNGSSFTTPSLQVAQGTQVFVGPMIGFDFGL